MNNLKEKIDLFNKITEQLYTLNKLKQFVENDINTTKSNTAVVFTFNYQAGFASVFGFLCKAYIYAKINQYDFYINHDNWQYTYKYGWHDYFTTLSMYNPLIKYNKVEHYSWHGLENIEEYTLKQYHDCVNEIFILRDDLIKKSEDFIKSIDDKYISIYVRRGDKRIENSYIDISDLISQIKIESDTKIFIQTDDYFVVEEITRLLPKNKIYTLAKVSDRGADADRIRSMSREDKKTHAEELFIELSVFLKGYKKYTDNRSNIGRLHKIMGLDSVVLYPFNTLSENTPLTHIIRPSFDLIK